MNNKNFSRLINIVNRNSDRVKKISRKNSITYIAFFVDGKMKISEKKTEQSLFIYDQNINKIERSLSPNIG